jgi:hypothetical protein
MGRSVALAVAGLVLVLLLASQFALPPIASHKIEDKLTAQGGSAHVSLHAFPALRLLWHHGSSIDVTGSGLHVDLGTGKQKVFQNLDGFGKVHIHLTDVTAGPFDTRSFALDRNKGSADYNLALQASVRPSDLATYLGSQAGGALGGLFGGIAGGLVPGGTQPVPVSVNATVQSRGGNPVVQSGGGTVAGVPVGPLLEALAVAVVARL